MSIFASIYGKEISIFRKGIPPDSFMICDFISLKHASKVSNRAIFTHVSKYLQQCLVLTRHS